MIERKLHQFACVLLVLAMVAITISPVLAADSGNSSANATSGSDNLKGLTSSPPPDNKTLISQGGLSQVSHKALLATAASASGSCVGDGISQGLMEIHAPLGSGWAGMGPWGWFHGIDASGIPIFLPTDPSGVTCVLVDVCGYVGGQWQIGVELPDGSVKDSGIFDFTQYPAPPGKNAQCYYLFDATSGLPSINVQSIFGSSSQYSRSSNEPINLATGNYFYQHQDLSIPGRGLPLTIARNYNSLDSYSGPFGTGWTFNYNMNLTVIAGNGNILVKREDGRRDLYILNPDGTYSPPPSVYDTLTKNADGSYTLEMKNHITYHFTPAGQLTGIVDNNGNTISLTYTGNYLTQVTDSSGRKLTFTYDAAGHIISIADPIGRTSSYTYDTNGNLVRFSDAMGGEYSYTYDENHWMTSITNPRGIQIMHNTYDGNGRVISQSNALAAVYNFNYDINNRITTQTDPLGRKTVYTFDNNGWELSETDDLGNTISYAYDHGNRISSTDANGHTAHFTYDAVGNIIQVVDPSGSSTSLTYDSNNNLVSGTDALGRQITFNYDANSNPVKVTNALGSVTTFAYDQNGQLISSQDANGHGTSLAYDNNGDPTAITDALGNRVTFSYDGVGRLVGTSDAKGGVSTFSYDALDRLVNVVDPLGHSASFSYDGAGNRISATDALGRTTSYAYSPMNQLTKVTDATGGTVNYAYDTVNNMVSMTDANGHTTNYAYDPLNRLTTVTDPLGRMSSNSYDAVGNTISVTDNNGNTTGFTYDALNRLTGISYPDKTSVSYNYDAVGNRLSMADGSGTTSYVYNGINQLTSVANPGGKTVTYGFDAVGNNIQMTYPDGKTVSYTYDGLNRLSDVTDWNGNVTSYAYDANSNLAGMTYPNGITTEYSYDKDNRLISLVNKDGHGIVSSYEYTLDAVGNRVNVNEKFDQIHSEGSPEQGIDNSGTGLNDASDSEDNGSDKDNSLVTTYGYDNLNRLEKVTDPLGNIVTYTYDPTGNRLSMVTGVDKWSSTINYNYDAGDQLLSAGGTMYTYDNNGNLIKKSEPEGTTSYGYDAANRLSSVSISQSPRYTPDSNDTLNEKDADTPQDSLKDKNENTVLHFAYDGDGNRIGESVTSDNRTESTQYLWDINKVVPQVLTESDGKESAFYTYGLQRISTTDPRGEQIYYQYDGLGSVRSLSDRRGNTGVTYSYDAFGEPLLTPDHGDHDFLSRADYLGDNDFLFTGEQMDTETGLIYLRARYYDPETGRFITRDPFNGVASVPPSLNRYAYGYNNPVRFTDPSGKDPLLYAALAGVIVNDGWYLGVNVGMEHQQFSGVMLGGRTVGGAVGGVVGAASLPAAGIFGPYIVGAAAGGSSYAIDTALTEPVLSAIGFPGTKEDFSWPGFTLAATGSGIFGGITDSSFTDIGIPKGTSSVTGKQFAGELGKDLVQTPWDAFSDYALNNNGPIRLGGSSSVCGALY
jgi:RHS repeat-associated protein